MATPNSSNNNNNSHTLGVPPLLPQQHRPCRGTNNIPAENIMALMTAAAAAKGQTVQPRVSLIEMISELARFLESRLTHTFVDQSVSTTNALVPSTLPPPSLLGTTGSGQPHVQSACQMGMNRVDMERFQRLMTSIQLICKLVATERSYDVLRVALDELIARVIGNDNVPLFNRVYVALLCGCIIEYGGHTTRIQNVIALLDTVITNFCEHKRRDEQKVQEEDDFDDSGETDSDSDEALEASGSGNKSEVGNSLKRPARSSALARFKESVGKRRRTNAGTFIVVNNTETWHSEETRKALLLVDRVVPAIATIISSLGHDGFRQLSEATTLVDKIHEIRMSSTGTRWLYMLSNMLMDEEIIVLHPEDHVGFRIRITCVSDNAALMVIITHLLWNRVPSYIRKRNMAAAVSTLSLFPPPPTNDLLVSIFDGTGPQQLEGERFTNIWFFYNWTALNEEMRIDPMAAQHWVWFEGAPIDIALFRGRRVILLGPMVYPRSFNVSRTFSMLRAQFSLVEQMSDEDTMRWLNDLSTNAAPNSQHRRDAEQYLEYRHSFFKTDP